MLRSLSMNPMTRVVRCCHATSTPEWAIVTLVIMLVAVAAVGSLGHLTASIVRNVGGGLHRSHGEAASPTETAKDIAASDAGPHDLLSRLLWTNGLYFLAIAVALVWLILGNRSLQRPAAPRPLATDLAEATSHRTAKKRQKICRRLYNDADTLLRGDITLRHLMTENPFTVGPNETVQRACEIMTQEQLDYLLVCGANRQALGLVSYYFLQRSSAKRVADAMLPNPFYVTPDAMLSSTVTQMLNEGVSCVVVVEQGQAVGIVTATDIQLTLQAAMHVLAKATSERRAREPEAIA